MSEFRIITFAEKEVWDNLVTSFPQSRCLLLVQLRQSVSYTWRRPSTAALL